jgi:NADH-quinone oxidoreductase subunit H
MTISAQFFVSTLTLLIVLHVMLLAVAYLIYVERKIASFVQDRIGPNRVGFTFGLVGDSSKKSAFGLGQPLADGIKFLVKEDYNPRSVDPILFLLAPAMAVIPAMIGWAIVPWGGVYEFAGWTLNLPVLGEVLVVEAGRAVVAVADVNIGVIYMLATGSLAVYGIVVGAWAANNKFAFFGGLRATAQMLSYEIPMGIMVLVVILLAGTARASDIVGSQVAFADWNLWHMPIAAILFFTCILAESNRAPFDLAECESELVGGYHTEYSSMKFALFFLGEYIHMVGGAAFFAILFLGGWSFPGLSIEQTGIVAVLLKAGVFSGKIFLLLCLMMLIRWTLPRFRFDQLMRLAWRGLIPLSLVILLLTGTTVFLGYERYVIVTNIAILAAMMIGPKLVPAGPAVNRRVELAGSRFSAPQARG